MVPDGGVMMFEGGAMPDGEAGGLVTQEVVRVAGREWGSGGDISVTEVAWRGGTANSCSF